MSPADAIPELEKILSVVESGTALDKAKTKTYMVYEDLNFIHSIAEGLIMFPFNQESLDECWFKHWTKTCRCHGE